MKNEVQGVHPSNCTRTHWGIADCPDCGLRWYEQADFPVVVPERYRAPKDDVQGGLSTEG
jgi:hypothetical protein